MKKTITRFSLPIALVIGAVAIILLTAIPAQSRPPLGVTNFDSIHLRDTGPTSQPALRVDQRGAGKIVEFMDGGTPVWSLNNGGGITQAGLETLTGGLSVAPNIVVSAPTAIATATPVAYINNAGAHDALVVAKNATPNFTIGNGGLVTGSGGASLSPNLVVSAPTAIATATPAAYINNAGAHNSLVIAKNATPNFTVGNAGVVTGLVLRHATAGQQLVTGTSVVTGTATASHGLTTVTFCLATMGEDPTAGAGDGAMVTTVVSANVCTLKVWQDDFVSAATEVDVDVHWLVVGTP